VQLGEQRAPVGAVIEIVAGGCDSTPISVHQNEDEHFLIVEGTAGIAYGDKTFDAAAGTSVTHAFCLAQSFRFSASHAGDPVARRLRGSLANNCKEGRY
jgi:mannose-6-phosphate isomerase-like protein (cupin superfamily)